MSVDEICGENVVGSTNWDPHLAKDFLATVHIGDYVRIHYRGGILRKRTLTVEGYVEEMSHMHISIRNSDPLERLMHVDLFKEPEIVRLGTLVGYQKLERPPKTT